MKKALLFLLLASCSHFSPQQADQSVFPLVGLMGGGTGFMVEAPSGKKYILTNAHVCEGTALLEEIIEVSGETDLCLIAPQPADNQPALRLAGKEPLPHDKVSVLGWGRLLGSTLTEGHWVGALGEPILSVKHPNYITASVLPGNSGSPVFNERSEVVGVVYATSTAINNRALLVPLKDIKRFLFIY